MLQYHYPSTYEKQPVITIILSNNEIWVRDLRALEASSLELRQVSLDRQ